LTSRPTGINRISTGLITGYDGFKTAKNDGDYIYIMGISGIYVDILCSVDVMDDVVACPLTFRGESIHNSWINRFINMINSLTACFFQQPVLRSHHFASISKKKK
jgi:hypothetical protein